MNAPFNIKAAVAETIAVAPVNMTEASKGGDYVPPAAGVCQLRFVSYIESGQHEDEYEGVKKQPYEVQLTFELSGPNHPPKVLDDGTKLPHRMTIYTSAAKGGYTSPLNEKASLYKLFRRMNYQGAATHIAELLGSAFLGTVVHKTAKDGKVRAYLKDDSGFTIQPPRYQDPMSGATVEVNVAEPISPVRCFLWNAPEAHLKPMWDSLFIDGAWEAEGDKPARSKNVIQEQIKKALNFAGSPIANLLAAGGTVMDLGKPQAPATTAVASPAAASGTAQTATSPSDPLAGIQ